MQIEITTPVDDETAAAIIAAVALALAVHEDTEPPRLRRSAWALAGILDSQAEPSGRRDTGWRVAGSAHV